MREHVGSYEIVRVLARGGMSVVYLAHQPTLDRNVALKQLELVGRDAVLAERFVREARLAAGLDHPNIVTLFDFFEHEAVPYIAMEYVGGGSLRPHVGSLSLAQTLGVLEGVLSGLAHAEGAGVVHRDLKPENVLLTRDGTAKIADFGVARAYNALTQLTTTGAAIGTPTYMAPEQALDERLGPYTDLYSLGVVAFELLSGRPPFDPNQTPMAVLYCHVHKPPPSLNSVAPAVPRPLAEWVAWLLGKTPDARPASAVETWESLEEIAVAELGPYWRRAAAIAPTPDPTAATEHESTIVAVPPAPTARAPRPAAAGRRRWVAAAAVGGTAVAAAAVATLALDGATPRKPARSPPLSASAARRVAVPYDFNGNGRAELVLGFPGSGASHAGAVLVGYGRAGRLVRPRGAQISGPLDRSMGFGGSLTSGDFDGDGHADLAVSAPGRDTVAVLHGGVRSLAAAPVTKVRAAGMRIDPGEGGYGSRLASGDMNRDGFDDLVVGAPEAEPGRVGSGVIEITYGGREGFVTPAQHVVRPADLAAFGTRIRLGDIDGDRNLDVVEGAPDDLLGAAGHMTYCLGTRTGPGPCRVLTGSVSSGTSALAVADVDDDGYDDILQGDAVVEPSALAAGSALGGEVRVWLGGRRGPSASPEVITQRPIVVPGDDEPGDEFGFSLGAGDLDPDRFDDIVIGVPGEDGGDGAVVVVRGGIGGRARAAHTRFFKGGGGIPGTLGMADRFGWGVAVLDVSGDDSLDVIASAHDAERPEDAVYVIEGRDKSAFARGETRVWRPLARSVRPRELRIPAIRLGRRSDG
ncbi:MAG TPA: protein kinase [Solirubrobacteraceae bacterium]|nr:protein kinase [Solirubrobacteraceae bacterium]